jgi:carboxypeptidase C (cathepsin A)
MTMQQHRYTAARSSSATASTTRLATTPPRPFTLSTQKELPKAADLRVYGLEKVEEAYAAFDGEMYAGTLPSDHDGRVGQVMFWLFVPTVQAVNETLTLWLNGGPGCSSFNCGVMMEHSPVTQPLHDAGYCCLQATPKLYVNPHTWTRATTMLYVEQPIGTGFSYGSPLPEDEDDAASDLYAFYQNFLQVFTQFQSYSFYITGESYAGMFVPSFARYFHIMNKEKDLLPVHLRGAALGNGWMDPSVQGPATIDYSWWHGLIDEPTRDALHHEWYNCYVKQQPGNAPFHALSVQDDCGIMWGILQAAGNPNAYDVTTWDPNVDQITFTSEAFYNRDDVKAALHAPTNITWHGCRGFGRRRNRKLQEQSPHRQLYMDNDRPWSVVPYVAELVDDGIPVLVYNGDRDMTTNMVGSELLLNSMSWSGATNWTSTAPRGLWRVRATDYPGGWAKEWANLTFVVVYNSGHMVPYNQPVAAYDLLLRFLQHESFIDEVAPSIRVDKLTAAAAVSEQSPLLASTVRPWSSGEIDIHQGHTVGALAASFLVGMVVASLLLWPRRSRSVRQYEAIPNTN